MKKITLSALVLIMVVIVCLVVWRVYGQSHALPPNSMMPVTLKVAKVRKQTLPLFLQVQGRVVPEHSVSVQPQVSGILQKVAFEEGGHVKKGQLLFLIDAAPFKAKLMSAKAAMQQAEADLARKKSLLARHYVTEQEYQDAKAEADQARAAFKTAKINLGYTRITAPISGRTGLVSRKSGNLVGSSDSDPLVTIIQMQPIEVQFALPQQKLAVIRQQKKGSAPLVIFASGENDNQFLAKGKLAFINNKVNNATGTFTLKARFDNHHEALWPGQFVNIKLQLAEQTVLTIPAAALQTGQKGNFVYQIKDGKTITTPVKLKREQGDLALLASGLSVGEKVVVQVPRNLRIGIPATGELIPVNKKDDVVVTAKDSRVQTP